jgi:hypothetical protein
MNDPDDYQRHSLDGLFTAVEYGDKTALEALKEFIRLRTDSRIVNVIVERHQRHGWRVRGIPCLSP